MAEADLDAQKPPRGPSDLDASAERRGHAARRRGAQGSPPPAQRCPVRGARGRASDGDDRGGVARAAEPATGIGGPTTDTPDLRHCKAAEASLGALRRVVGVDEVRFQHSACVCKMQRLPGAVGGNVPAEV